MNDFIAKFFDLILRRFIDEKDVIYKIVVLLLWNLAKRTDNSLDDQIVEGIAQALGVEIPK